MRNTNNALFFRLMRVLIVAIFLLFFATNSAYSQPRIGLWVESEGQNQPYNSLKGLEQLRAFASSGPYTDLYCQIYRGGRSWFPSMLADDTPYRKAMKQGFDPLVESIKLAKANGQKIHAWFNVMRVISNRDAPLFQVLGHKVALQDNYNQSLYHYKSGNPPKIGAKDYKLGTPGVWLEPSHAELRHYIVEQIREVLISYPELDGIHLDMIRQPIPLPQSKRPKKRIKFGHGNEVMKKYKEFAETSSVNNSDWKEWRRAQFSLLVFEIKEMMLETAPKKELSAAVIADYDRAMNWAYQDWRAWLRGGVIDTAIPMAYTSDRGLFSKLVKSSNSFGKHENIQIGLGAWLMLDKPKRFKDQIKLVLKSGLSGVNVFSYSNLQSQKGKRLVTTLSSVLEPKDKS